MLKPKLTNRHIGLPTGKESKIYQSNIVRMLMLMDWTKYFINLAQYAQGHKITFFKYYGPINITVKSPCDEYPGKSHHI